jgi:hypothetical protein
LKFNIFYFSLLFQAASQNIIPADSETALADLQDHLLRVGVKPGATFKRIWMYPKKTSDPDDHYDKIYRFKYFIS